MLLNVLTVSGTAQRLRKHSLYSVLVYTREVSQFLHRAVLDKPVGQPHARYPRTISVVVHPFGHRSSESSVTRTVFYCHYPAEVLSRLAQYIFVKGLKETHVIVCHAHSGVLFLNLGYGTTHGPIDSTAMSFPSFSLRPLPVSISSSGQRQSVFTPHPRG